jgi:hypothetical protein
MQPPPDGSSPWAPEATPAALLAAVRERGGGVAALAALRRGLRARTLHLVTQQCGHTLLCRCATKLPQSCGHRCLSFSRALSYACQGLFQQSGRLACSWGTAPGCCSSAGEDSAAPHACRARHGPLPARLLQRACACTLRSHAFCRLTCSTVEPADGRRGRRWVDASAAAVAAAPQGKPFPRAREADFAFRVLPPAGAPAAAGSPPQDGRAPPRARRSRPAPVRALIVWKR